MASPIPAVKNTRETRRAQSFTSTEVKLALNVFNEALAGNRVSPILLAKPEFRAVVSKFVRMSQPIEE